MIDEKQAFCLNSRRWLVFMDLFMNYPSTCPHEGDCDGCGYFQLREPTKYLKKKERDLKEAMSDLVE